MCGLTQKGLVGDEKAAKRTGKEPRRDCLGREEVNREMSHSMMFQEHPGPSKAWPGGQRTTQSPDPGSDSGEGRHKKRPRRYSGTCCREGNRVPQRIELAQGDLGSLSFPPPPPHPVLGGAASQPLSYSISTVHSWPLVVLGEMRFLILAHA